MIRTGAYCSHSESANTVGTTYREEFAVWCDLCIAVTVYNTAKGTHGQLAAPGERHLTRVLHGSLDKLCKRYS